MPSPTTIVSLYLSVGFLITSLLDKTHLTSYGSDSYGGEGSIAFRARVVLFLGVALMAGGLAGEYGESLDARTGFVGLLRLKQLGKQPARSSYAEALTR